MRKFCISLSISLAVTSYSDAQSMNGPVSAPRDVSAFQNIVNINGQDGFYLKKDLYLTSAYTIIDGERVLGIPFLNIEWLYGSLTTPDGRVYNDQGLKYNVQNQTVFFMQGKDSLEVNEEIKEFTINIPGPDSVLKATRFVNANQYQKERSTFYYEVISDNEKGQLLRTNQKIIAAVADGIIASKSQKYLSLERTYFYYDKVKKKLYKIKVNSNMRTMLALTEQQATELRLNNYDLSKEVDIISLMKAYNEKFRLKAF